MKNIKVIKILRLFSDFHARNSINSDKFMTFRDQYQYLGRRRYETEPFKFTTKRLI